MIVLSTVSCVAGVFCPEFWSYTVTRVIIGLGAQGLFIIGFSLSIEIVGAKETLPYLDWITYKVVLANFIYNKKGQVIKFYTFYKPISILGEIKYIWKQFKS